MAGLYGDQVRETDMLPTGESVRTAAVDYRPLPARLSAVIAFPDLENLLHRRPPPADCGVKATAVPLPAAVAGGAGARAARVSREEAEKMLDELPLRLADGLTRGQAEDLLAQLARERVAARLVREAGVSDASRKR